MRWSAFVAVVLTAGCAAASPAAVEPDLVTIESLLENPQKYANQTVRIQGAAVVGFESTFVCPGVETIARGQPQQCLWLSSGTEQLDLGQFNLKCVQLVGRFKPGARGHMGLFGGTLVVQAGVVTGSHTSRGFGPPPPPASSANNSSKPTPLRGAA